MSALDDMLCLFDVILVICVIFVLAVFRVFYRFFAILEVSWCLQVSFDGEMVGRDVKWAHCKPIKTKKSIGGVETASFLFF